MADSPNSDASGPFDDYNPSERYELLEHICRDWRGVHHSTEPADRARAEAGVQAAYAAAGLPEPTEFLWVSSPQSGFIAAQVLQAKRPPVAAGELWTRQVHDDVLQSFLDGHRDWLPKSDRRRIEERVGPIQEQVGHHSLVTWPGEARALGDVIGDALGLSAWQEVATQIIHNRGSSNPGGHAAAMMNGAINSNAVRELLAPPAFGQHSAANLAHATALGALAEADTTPLAGILEIARSAGFWWPFEKVVILSERPVVRRTDAKGRLHCGSGPALAYGDGFAAWRWRGVTVPSGLIRGRWGVADVLSERERQIRRCAIERLGWAFVEQAKLRQIGETVPDPENADHLVSLFKVPRRYFERRRGYFDDAWEEPNTVRLILCSSLSDGKPCHDGVTVPAKFVDIEGAVEWATWHGLMTPRPG